ncbi:AAA family ATPase [Methanobacterium formicicum]|uniref:AAA family ATPase n=1 Tax=Methanobacterium formicicum TaxID=2162 RepID=UPI0024128C5F|nr:AAA family ATPase [Methanobacterium formicicum]MDG3546606.1 AAA family ATPase [Methanobacterium formicicum]
MKDMKLEIKNFGPINEAEIEIGKITVIAGPNASGKTTSSKLFYCFLAASSSEGAYIINESIIQRLSRPLERTIYKINNADKREKIRDLRKQLRYIDDLVSNDEMLELYFDTINQVHIDFNKSEMEDINLILSMILDNLVLYKNTLIHMLQIEFNKPKLDDVKLSFKQSDIHNNQHEVLICNDGVHKVTTDYLSFFEVKNVSYIETPYILDFFSHFRRVRNLPPRYRQVNRNHQSFLIEKLNAGEEKDVFDKTLNENIIQVQKKIQAIIEGNLRFDENTFQFVFEQGDRSFHSKDVASGIKSVGILQMLLENRQLPKDSYLIMDEPEVHLHPAWQVKLAEILVLLSKELNISVYVNSHSPHFIEAIEVYSKYYDSKYDKDVKWDFDSERDVKFYLTKENEEGKFNFKKIERNNLLEIYKCLSHPYDEIDAIRGKTRALDVVLGRD